MHNRRLLILFLLIAYIFSPTLFTWMINPVAAWYRPYIIWGLLIVAAYIYHRRKKPDEL